MKGIVYKTNVFFRMLELYKSTHCGTHSQTEGVSTTPSINTYQGRANLDYIWYIIADYTYVCVSN